MAQYISPKKRAEILSLITDDGMSVIDAAKTFSTTEKAVVKWLANYSRAEVQRLKQERKDLKAIIKELKRGMIWNI